MMSKMRTTLTIEDDIAEKLKRVARRQRMSFKDVVNRALRRGLEPSRGSSTKRRTRLKTRKLAYRSGVDEVKLKERLDELDVEDSSKV